MGRAKRIYSTQYPYHITARCINKQWFDVSIDKVWNLFSDHLYFCHHAFDLQIHSFVLMSNHFHLLISTPNGNISEIMRYLMTETSRDISQHSGRINQTYGGPYYSNLITTDIHFQHVYKYIYRNPIEAGIVNKVEQYPYSTLPGLLGATKIIIPLISDEQLFNNVEKTLRWLNTKYQEDTYRQLKLAVRRNTFKFPICKSTGKENPLNHILS